ncbi:MAG: hypothetical protein ABI760_15220 [Ferruginibacter sp.]
MIKKQRKRHLQTWSVLAVLIPAGIISAWLVVPGAVTERLLQPAPATGLPIVTGSDEKNNYTANLRSNNDRSQYQLELIQKKASTAPSLLIFQAANGDSELIGRVETKGRYYFALKPDSTKPYSFILYDIFHKEVIDSIIFKTNLRIKG